MEFAEYTDVFVQEAFEQLEALERELLHLEHTGNLRGLQNAFRAAHTLKGNCRSMGFTRLAELTHELEDVLDELRYGHVHMEPSLGDALLASADALRAMVESVAAGNGDEFEVEGLIRELRSHSKSANPSKGASELSSVELFAVEQLEDKTFIVTLEPDCTMKFARAIMVVAAAGEMGESVLTTPELEELENEQFGDSFAVTLRTSHDTGDVATRLAQVSEVLSVVPVAYAEPTVEDQTDADHETQDLAGALEPQWRKETRRADSVQTVRVDVGRLDSLMDLIGELVIDRTRLSEAALRLERGFGSDPDLQVLSEVVGHLGRVTADLQGQIMKARMLPIEVVFDRFPRIVRDLARKLGKEVELELVGSSTELDRTVIEVIADPLLHILSNCVDHGLETPEVRAAAGKPVRGKLIVSARHQDNSIVIDVQDDGKGIDVDRVCRKAIELGVVSEEAAQKLSKSDALALIFHSGLSTASEVTEISGRGVGMDVVANNLRSLGGLIEVTSEFGVGTRFVVRLPLTLAIIRGLLVKTDRQTYVLPISNVIEIVQIDPTTLQSVAGKIVMRSRGQTIPVHRLCEVLGHDRQARSEEKEYLIVVGFGHQRAGIIVDRLIGEQEIVIKAIGELAQSGGLVSGATILGDGQVAMIIDVSRIISGEAYGRTVQTRASLAA